MEKEESNVTFDLYCRSFQTVYQVHNASSNCQSHRSGWGRYVIKLFINVSFDRKCCLYWKEIKYWRIFLSFISWDERLVTGSFTFIWQMFGFISSSLSLVFSVRTHTHTHTSDHLTDVFSATAVCIKRNEEANTSGLNSVTWSWVHEPIYTNTTVNNFDIFLNECKMKDVWRFDAKTSTDH